MAVTAAALVPVLPGGTPHSWTPAFVDLPPALSARAPGAYHVLRTATHQDPVDFGLAWGAPVTIGRLEVDFASIGGRAYEPSPAAQTLEVRRDAVWRAVAAEVSIDHAGVGALAPVQGRGAVRWTYRFAPERADAVRVVAHAPAHLDPGFQCIAVAGMRASGSDGLPVVPGVSLDAAAQAEPAWLEPGADLAVTGAGAVHTRGSPASVRWPHPVMVDSVRAASAIRRVEARVGGAWRPVEAQPAPGSGVARFTPIAVTGLRVFVSGGAGRLAVWLSGAGRRYFEAVRLARTDVLGARFRAFPTRDLAAMESLLLPIDFTKTAIGRPADAAETMVAWTGAFWQADSAACVDPRDGKPLPAQAVDRWFAPVTEARPETGAPARASTVSRWLDGWLPAAVTVTSTATLRVEQTLLVTAPGSGPNGTLVRLDVSNRTGRRVRAAPGYALGWRRMYAAPGEAWTPFLSDPQPTGYRLDDDRRTVWGPSGDIILHAFQPGEWGGTSREGLLTTPMALAPRERRTLWYFAPSVAAAQRDAAALARLSPDGLTAAFRAYWSRWFEEAAVLDLPEPRLNAMYRSLLAQCAIIGLDGDVARYGAYAYEAYFGIEEGWPAVALAQFGLPEYGRRIADYMLSPDALDKRNYHHQYRNGLAPWYAVTIARLTDDDAWLRKHTPVLEACAEWTIAATASNSDARFGGILPRHVYGGDISMPAYSFYSNAVCWRGLHDTAQAFEWLGDAERAARYRGAASAYHARIMALADALVDRSTGLPFLPMAFGLGEGPTAREKEPSYPVLAAEVPSTDTWAYIANYWNLFAPMLLEARLFAPGDQRAGWIPEYMERRGGVLTGQARFSLGYDCIYGKGYIEDRLERGDREGFLTSLYGLLAHGASRTLYAYPEVSGVFPLRTDNRALHREYERERWSWLWRPSGGWVAGWQNQEGEPLSAGPGMALQLLRMALVREDYAQDPPAALRILDGAPAHWFTPGSRVAFRGLRTFLGAADVEVRCAQASARGTVRLATPERLDRFTLRLPAHDARSIEAARVTGGTLAGFTADEVTVKAPGPSVSVHVTYRPRPGGRGYNAEAERAAPRLGRE